MANEVAINGDDQMLEINDNEDQKDSKLMQKIEVLEKEKNDLVCDNEVMRDRVSKLQGKLEVLESEKAELEREIAKSDADKKSLESVAARAAELEIEVSRLQHDLITAEADGAEANKEVVELKREVENLKLIGIEKGQKLNVLENERTLLLKKIDEVENEMRVGEKAGEEKVLELKKKLEFLAGRENGEKAKIAEKEREINELNKKVKDLELVILKTGEEIEKMKREKKEFEGAKSVLEGLLEKSEQRVKEMGEKLGELGKDLEVSEHVISGLREKTLDGINGIHVIKNREKGIYGVKPLTWPILTASTGVVVTAGALWYLRLKQR